MTDTPHDDFGDPTECDQSELLRNLKVEFRHVDQLKPWERNARTHSSKQVRQIAASITEFGYTLPLLIDEENRILAGHGRRLALTRLGIETVPVICIEGMTEAQKRAYVLADNKLAENACWDPEILSIELQHLVEIDAEFDVTVTGFETPEIDLIIEGVGVGGSDVEPETVPELDLSLPLVSTQGDLWFMGRHRLLCGDATTASDFEHLMDGARAEMVFIDPPYNVRIDGNVCGLGQTRHREFVMASGEMSETEFIKFLASVFVLLAANSTDGSVHYICIDWRHLFELLTAARGVYTETLNHCVWVKSNGGMGSLYRSQHEFVVVFKNG
ncbi:MAG: ParB N-terminal domain-containing protein, partial [Rhodospirillaceae bacterium]|nr:ParB N-terminal domain-containing protein [Rhodospirillaceae bacterium]